MPTAALTGRPPTRRPFPLTRALTARPPVQPFLGPFKRPYRKAPYGETSYRSLTGRPGVPYGSFTETDDEEAYGKAGALREARYGEERSLREGPVLTGRQARYGKPVTGRNGPYGRAGPYGKGHGKAGPLRGGTVLTRSAGPLREGPGSLTGPSQRRTPLQEAPYEERRSLREGPVPYGKGRVPYTGPSQRRTTKRLTGRQGRYGKPVTGRNGPYGKGRSLREGCPLRGGTVLTGRAGPYGKGHGKAGPSYRKPLTGRNGPYESPVRTALGPFIENNDL